jgi:integrase
MIRYVLVSSRALQTLVSLHARFPESELVFGDRSRSYLQTLLKKFHLLACKIGAENMRLHSLRRAMVRHLHHLANSEQEETAIQYLADHALHTAKSELDLQTILEIAKPFLEDLWAELDVKKV